MAGKSHWCQFCHAAPLDGDSPLLHQLEAVLPPDYDHCLCSLEAVEAGGFKASMKLQAFEEQEVQKWLQDFQNTSKTTWRVSRTYPGSRKKNKYRVDLRCQHGGYGLYKASKKNTFCPAMLYLVLKQDCFRQKRSRSCDPHLHDQLNFHIHLRHTHNHQIDAAESLRHRDVSKETVQKLERLFRHGHTPSTALKALKNELRAQTGEEGFEEAILDHALCPDLAFCYRWFYKLFPERKGKRKGKKKKGTTGETELLNQNGTDSPDETFEALQSLQENPVQFCVPEGSVFAVVNVGSVQTPAWSQSQSQSQTEVRLMGMFRDLLEKLKTDAELEESARTMVCSYETMSSDRDKLMFALKTFGKMKRSSSGGTAAKRAKRARVSVQKDHGRSNGLWMQPIDAKYISSTSHLVHPHVNSV